MAGNPNTILYGQLLDAFSEHRESILAGNPAPVAEIRSKAIESFRKQGFPTNRMENWRNTDLSPTLSKTYKMLFDPTKEDINLSNIFRCRIHDLDTDQISLMNGWYIREGGMLEEHPNGMISGSLAAAMKKYPELVAEHFSRYANPDKDGFTALNTAFAQDGFFLYIPDNVEVDTPIQMVSIINWNEDLMVQTRNLIILGKNSRLTLVHCDDSTNQQAIFKNSVTEVHMAEDSVLDHYKLQNLNNQSSLINSTFFHQEAGSRLTSNLVTLNGGLLRNYTQVTLNGRGAGADIYGVYLMDRNQHIDNQVYVDHAQPDCYSNELFKGILDEEASAVFNGHILVRKDAQRTNAYQNNRNILMTDTARANAKPFLEIYADDVKCSHGATVGQLDPQQLFYLRSRGICEANARLLLLYAFTAEVISKISIHPLRERIDDMVKQRLRGELAICDTCALHCEGPKKEIIFDIDMSKI
ncbi:MAG: Fe-S cluster assembly protein SufD [Bacteroidetes bacterium]|nr:Fe-S cluster assembly protein SufD [Bacteroidota bacterium]